MLRSLGQIAIGWCGGLLITVLLQRFPWSVVDSLSGKLGRTVELGGRAIHYQMNVSAEEYYLVYFSI